MNICPGIFALSVPCIIHPYWRNIWALVFSFSRPRVTTLYYTYYCFSQTCICWIGSNHPYYIHLFSLQSFATLTIYIYSTQCHYILLTASVKHTFVGLAVIILLYTTFKFYLTYCFSQTCICWIGSNHLTIHYFYILPYLLFQSDMHLLDWQ